MVEQHIVLVEDDLKLNKMLSQYFIEQGYSVTSLLDGSRLEEFTSTNTPDLILLDLMLPGKDGLTLCRDIRPFYNGRILILTASDDDFDHVSALEIGADDFISKPVKPRVLLARIRNLLRRETAYSTIGSSLNFGGLELIKNRHLCLLSGLEIDLTESEFSLLWLLASSSDTVLSRNELTRELRGIEYDGLDRTIDNRIVSLRKKLADSASPPQKILTIRGKGYLFVPDAW